MLSRACVTSKRSVFVVAHESWVAANDSSQRYRGTHPAVEVSSIDDRGEANPEVSCRRLSFDAAEAEPKKARGAGQRIQAVRDRRGLHRLHSAPHGSRFMPN